jgi:group II intron reverse transcriptase/maturase
VKIQEVKKRVYTGGRLRRAWEQIRKNAGAAGVDKMTVRQFEQRRQELLELMTQKLAQATYRFKPVRRTLIEKEGSSKKRKLGIPTVMDRVVGQAMHLVPAEIFDASFSRSNFGFRVGKSQAAAIRHVQKAVREGYTWCASIDLKNFFDEIPHGVILKLLRRRIRDEGFITLVARALKAGVIIEGVKQKSTKGCPQGSPLSPILANIVLNEMDQELEKRGHRFCRWADDFVILTRSEKAAQRVMQSITRFLEEELQLPVNREKSRVARIGRVDFLGFQIHEAKIGVSPKAQKKFKRQVRQLTKRNNPLSMNQIITALNEFVKGWVNYFRIQEMNSVLARLDRFVRNRLRSMQLKKWKKPKKFQRMMIRAGFLPEIARKTWVKMDRWSSIARREVLVVLNLAWFRRQGLIFLDDYTNRNLELPFPS